MRRSGARLPSSRLSRFALLLLPAALQVSAGVASADLIVNGDFELPVPSNGTDNGWTSSGTGVFWSATGGNPSGNFVLNESGQQGSDPTIEQAVSDLAIGGWYRIEGERLSFAPGFGSASALAFAVLLDGDPILELDRGDSVAAWEAFAVDFVATATTHTIGFAAERSGDDSSYRIDNVSLQLVPEPDASLLSLAGFATIVVLVAARRAWS